MSVLAWDSETVLIADRTSVQHGNATIKTSPYTTPTIVLGSFATDVSSGVLCPEKLYELLTDSLNRGDLIICHNAPFDIDVVCTACPSLWGPFCDALDAGRVMDTKFLDILYRLSVGYFDKPKHEMNWARPHIQSRSLKDLAREYCGKEISKDLLDPDGDPVRLSFAKWIGRLEKMYPICRDYALEDAVCTLEVFKVLQRCIGYPWTAPAETRMAVVTHCMDKQGAYIDPTEAQRLYDKFSQDMPALQAATVEAGLARWEHQPGTIVRQKVSILCDNSHDWERRGEKLVRFQRFKNHGVESTADPRFVLNTATLRAELLKLSKELSIPDTDLKFTETGLLCAGVDEWADRIPAGSHLERWARYAKLDKILGTYLELYKGVSRIFPRWEALGAKTGRMSASSPAVQQIPKRKWGIRSMFVPSPGNVFVIADYSYAELVTLAQAMKDIGIQGPLYQAIQSGDPHIGTAALVLDRKVSTWQRATLTQLCDLSEDVSLMEMIAGMPPLHDVDIPASRLTGSVCPRIATLLNSGTSKFRKESLYVITATTLDALIQNTSLLGLVPTTHATCLVKVVQEGSPLTTLDLARLIGKEGLAWIRTHTQDCVVGVSKTERQAAKALNFGVSGGLGVVKLADYARKNYGVAWSGEDARAAKDKYLTAYPDVAQYMQYHNFDYGRALLAVTGRPLEWWKLRMDVKTIKDLKLAMLNSSDPAIKQAAVDADFQLTVKLRTGFVRAKCLYTEGCNTRFQGLAASVTKDACWRLFKLGYIPALVVHDEIVLDIPPDKADNAKYDLQVCMLDAFRTVCPDVGHFAKVELTGPVDRWGPATDKEGKAI